MSLGQEVHTSRATRCGHPHPPQRRLTMDFNPEALRLDRLVDAHQVVVDLAAVESVAVLFGDLPREDTADCHQPAGLLGDYGTDVDTGWKRREKK